jgi:hypothetical protein
LEENGDLRLTNIIEIGEYAHFALLAWKTTGEMRFKTVAEQILMHIERNFDAEAGFWRPFDAANLRRDVLTRLIRPALRFAMLNLPLRGRLVARAAEHLASFAVIESYPQYAMNLMDAEALLDTLDGSCHFPQLTEQTRAAITWAETHCSGPFVGSLVESCRTNDRPPVYPVAVINDRNLAALWPTTCLLIAYCGMNDNVYLAKAKGVADWILSVQNSEGGFNNFQNPDGSVRPLQSGNVNFYASMALWLFNEVYNHGRVKLFTK